MANAIPRPSYFKDTTPYLLFVLFTATIGPLLFGYHLAELNEPQDVLTCAKQSVSTDMFLSPLPSCIPMTSAQVGLVSSIFTLGGFIGALSSGSAAGRYGRLRTMRWITLFFTAGGLAEALADSILLMSVGRFISGLGAGASLVVAPIYISELAPPAEKGFFGALTQVNINFGIFIAQLLGFFLSRGQLWRVILGVGGCIGLNQLAMLFFAIESPRWSTDKGDATAAREDLQSIRRQGYDLQNEIDAWAVERSEQGLDEEQTLLSNSDVLPNRSTINGGRPSLIRKETVSMIKVLRHPDYNRAVLAVMVVMVAQQFTGINSIVMYGVKLLSGILTTSSASVNLLVSAVNLIVTAICAPLVDRIGRKWCLIISISGMGISAFLLGIAIISHIPILAAVTVLTFVGSFGVGLGPVPFILSAELVDSTASAATQSWALAANWSSTFMVAQFFPIVNEAMGPGRVYFVFAALAAGFAIFVLFFVPETMGKKDANEVWGRERVRRLD